MKDQVKELKVLDLKNNTNIFDSEKFIIPLYQRAYAWEDKQLVQLLEDINDIEEGENTISVHLSSPIPAKSSK